MVDLIVMKMVVLMMLIFEKDTGLYLTNNEFKDAMLMCGYEPVNPNELNWNYCISKKSPAFTDN